MEEESIDLRELIFIIRQNVKTIGKIALGFIVVAVLYLLIASPVYESTSLLRIKQPKGLGSSLLDSLPGGNAANTQQLMSTYSEILKSRSVIVPVIEKTEEADAKGRFPDYDGYIKGRIATVPFKNTEILKFTANAKTAEDAQKINQLIVDGFLNRLTDLTRTEQRATKDFIATRLVDAKKELDVAESALQDYKQANHIVDPSEQAKNVAAQLALVDKAAAENQINLNAAQARLAAAGEQLGSNAASIADNATVKGYKTKLAELEATRVQYQEKYTEKHPKLKEVESQIDEVTTQMNNEIAKISAMESPSDNPVHQGLLASKLQSEAEVGVAEAKKEALAKITSDNNRQIDVLSAKEQGYVRVARDATVAQDIYVMLAKRLEEAKVAEVAVSTEVQVVDTATLPDRPIKPRKALTLVLAALLGVLAGCGYCIAKELMNRTVKTEEDIEKYLGLSLIGSVPDSDSMREAIKYPKKKNKNRLRRWLGI